MTSTEAGALSEVHLLGLPVPLVVKVRQRFEDLQREFALIAANGHDDDHVPARLMRLVDALSSRYAGVTDAATERLDDAIDRGDEVIVDHVLVLPADAAAASRALGDMLDEADEYCRSGKHLLTLATGDDCRAYRRWYLGQVADQLTGRPPTPWSLSRKRTAGESSARAPSGGPSDVRPGVLRRV